MQYHLFSTSFYFYFTIFVHFVPTNFQVRVPVRVLSFALHTYDIQRHRRFPRTIRTRPLVLCPSPNSFLLLACQVRFVLLKDLVILTLFELRLTLLDILPDRMGCGSSSSAGATIQPGQLALRYLHYVFVLLIFAWRILCT